jgi:hypothetical protein
MSQNLDARIQPDAEACNGLSERPGCRMGYFSGSRSATFLDCCCFNFVIFGQADKLLDTPLEVSDTRRIDVEQAGVLQVLIGLQQSILGAPDTLVPPQVACFMPGMLYNLDESPRA